MNIVSNEGDILDPYGAFIGYSKYSRWIESEGRRENWGESVDRYVNFLDEHLKKNYPLAQFDLEEIREAVLNFEAMPSMRAMMTAGPALEKCNVAAYNCSFIGVDSLRAFDEAMYILMCGTGVGFSVESKYVDKLPQISEHFENTHTTIVVGDSKAGWARAFKELLALLWQGQIPMWDVSKVRPAGSRLKTFGGRSSGPDPLVDLFKFCVEVITNAAGRKLKPIEAHDIMCKVADIVVVGGVRRSAMISLSNLEDYEMAKAKSGSWWETNGQRRLANNSAVYEDKPSTGEFMNEWMNLYESKSGERGIFSLANAQRTSSANGRRDGSKVAGTNPCGEILLRNKGFCNLSEVVVRPEDTLEDLKKKVRLATLIGTIQSTLTDFKYLRKVWHDNANEERLLGVSLTGHVGSHSVLRGVDEIRNGHKDVPKLREWLSELKQVAIESNKEFADKLGINQSVAITTVKPSGTVSQLVNASSGMHPWHSEYYIRSVRGDNKDPLTRFLKDAGIPNEPDIMKPLDTTVFYFPIKAPDDALTRNDITAIEHLEVWKAYKLYWTEHNPSITVTVREHEWVDVAAWVYRNWEYIGGISFLPHSDHNYKQAPYEEVSKEEYEAFLKRMPKEIFWNELSFYETEDTTTGSQELACVAGSCDIVDISSVETIEQ